MSRKLIVLSVQRSSLSRLFTTNICDTQVGIFRQENKLILTLPSTLITARSNVFVSSIEPFVLHPPLIHKFSELQTQSLSKSQVVENIVNIIERSYDLNDRSDQFVGSMGENDGGVWFLSNSRKYDALDYWEMIQDITNYVKENRHGIPFGIYSSGRSSCGLELEMVSKLENDLCLSEAEITLGTGNPSTYMELAGYKTFDSSVAQRDFNRTCNFIASLAETGIPVSVSVAPGKYAMSGTALGKALGASNVIVRDLLPNI